jgi:hypothetical protein
MHHRVLESSKGSVLPLTVLGRSAVRFRGLPGLFFQVGLGLLGRIFRSSDGGAFLVSRRRLAAAPEDH